MYKLFLCGIYEKMAFFEENQRCIEILWERIMVALGVTLYRAQMCVLLD